MRKKIVMVIIISISMLFGLLTIENSAVNNITGNTQTNEKSNNVESNNTSSKNVTKSNNANLSELGITPHDFKGFRYGTTSYEVAVPEETEKVEVYAKAQNSKAVVTGTGKKDLEKGENKVEVVVTAEDGTKKTYTINIIRTKVQEGEKEENSEDKNDKEVEGLTNLKINNLNLSPEFKTDIYEYKTQYIGEETKLNIETMPTNEGYIVEVVGNENLQEGENIITILVSDKNGDNIATYQILLNKELIDVEAIAREESEKQQKIIIGIGIAILVIIILFIIIRCIKSKKEYSDEDVYYSEEENDNDNEDEIDETIEKERKERVKEKFLQDYTSKTDINLENENQEKNIKRKHKGKRFK